MTKLKAEDFEQAVRLAGTNLIALKGVMLHKVAPKEVIFSEVPEDCEDLTVELQSLIMPGQFGPMVDTCFDLPNESEPGEVMATKSGQLWIRSLNAWVFLTNVAGVQ